MMPMAGPAWLWKGSAGTHTSPVRPPPAAAARSFSGHCRCVLLLFSVVHAKVDELDQGATCSTTAATNRKWKWEFGSSGQLSAATAAG